MRCLSLVSYLLCAAPLVAIACTGTVVDTQAACNDGQARNPPTILAPTGGELKQPEELIRFETNAGDVPTDAPRLAEFEVHLLAAGEPTILIWSGSLDSAGPVPSIDLSQGTFATGFSALWSWNSYGVRSRVRDGGELCDFGDWSPFHDFKIDDGSEALFNEEVIRDVEITLSEESFDAIDAEARQPVCKPYARSYYPGTVTFDGVTYENAGVRSKGGCGSSRKLSDNGKASFKINLSDYGTGETCPTTRRARGLKRITLNNQVQDRSATHERLAYRFYDLVGVPVPRRAPIRVFVNNLSNDEGLQLWGLYLHLESIDRRFLQRRYEGTAAEGMLYEGTYYCDLVPTNLPDSETGPKNCFDKKFGSECSTPDPNGDPYNYAPLISFINQIDALPSGGFYPAITEFVDFDAFLSLWAADTIMNHWDGAVFGGPNNYRVYHEPMVDKWGVIPSGMDQSWNAGQNSIDPWDPASIIAKRCLQEKPCEDAFAARLKQVLVIFENADFAGQAEAIRTQVAPEVAADPRKESHDFLYCNEFSTCVDDTIAFIHGRPAQINAWLTQHGY